MKTKQTTKRALLGSAIAMVLCLALLMGSTFAWFTDSASTGVNTIQAGNLDIDLEYNTVDPSTENWKTVEGATDLFEKISLWEPGTTGVVYFRLTNHSSLALKYRLAMNFTGETTGLNEDGGEIRLSNILKFGVADGRATAFGSRAEAIHAVDAKAKLLSDGFTEDVEMATTEKQRNFALVVYMPETTANEANYRGDAVPTINLGITLNATQNTVESDSFDNTYDDGAWDPFRKDDRLNELVEAGYTPVSAASDLAALTGAENPTGEPVKIVMADNLQTDVMGPGPQNVQIKGAAEIDFNNNQVVRETGNGNGLLVQSPDADVTLRNAEFISVKGGNVLRVEKVNSLTIEDSSFICQAPGSTGNRIVQFYASQADKPMDIVFKNCTFDKGYVDLGGNASNFNVRFENCKFVWNDKSGSSFVQVGYYTPGTYTFDNCEFEFNNWWSGPLVRTDASSLASVINLNNVTVVGSAGANNRQPKVVDGNTAGAARNTTVNCTGTNTYTYDGIALDWDTVVKGANVN